MKYADAPIRAGYRGGGPAARQRIHANQPAPRIPVWLHPDDVQAVQEIADCKTRKAASGCINT